MAQSVQLLPLWHSSYHDAPQEDCANNLINLFPYYNVDGMCISQKSSGINLTFISFQYFQLCTVRQHYNYHVMFLFVLQHRNHRAETYKELVKDLNMHLKSDRLKVKVILAWINKQNIGRLSFGSKLPSPNTPNGYMMLIQANQGTYPVFFALLCR